MGFREAKASDIQDLAAADCVPCRGGVPPLAALEAGKLLARLGGGWQLQQVSHHLSKVYIFKDFKDALAFTNRVGELAEQQGHHPDLLLSWGRVRIDIWTHKVDGLTESDFILAAKIDAL